VENVITFIVFNQNVITFIVFNQNAITFIVFNQNSITFIVFNQNAITFIVFNQKLKAVTDLMKVCNNKCVKNRCSGFQISHVDGRKDREIF
jgi:hypothetical protein